MRHAISAPKIVNGAWNLGGCFSLRIENPPSPSLLTNLRDLLAHLIILVQLIITELV